MVYLKRSRFGNNGNHVFSSIIKVIFDGRRDIKGSTCFKTRLINVVNDARRTAKTTTNDNHHLNMKIKYYILIYKII